MLKNIHDICKILGLGIYIQISVENSVMAGLEPQAENKIKIKTSSFYFYFISLLKYGSVHFNAKKEKRQNKL